MSDLETVRSLTVFEGSVEKRWIAIGDEWDVTPARAAELAANGLIERVPVLLPGSPMLGAPLVPLPPAAGLPVLGATPLPAPALGAYGIHGTVEPDPASPVLGVVLTRPDDAASGEPAGPADAEAPLEMSAPAPHEERVAEPIEPPAPAQPPVETSAPAPHDAPTEAQGRRPGRPRRGAAQGA